MFSGFLIPCSCGPEQISSAPKKCCDVKLEIAKERNFSQNKFLGQKVCEKHYKNLGQNLPVSLFVRSDPVLTTFSFKICHLMASWQEKSKKKWAHGANWKFLNLPGNWSFTKSMTRCCLWVVKQIQLRATLAVVAAGAWGANVFSVQPISLVTVRLSGRSALSSTPTLVVSVVVFFEPWQIHLNLFLKFKNKICLFQCWMCFLQWRM